jgi:hypothetical protein
MGELARYELVEVKAFSLTTKADSGRRKTRPRSTAGDEGEWLQARKGRHRNFEEVLRCG